LSIVYAIAAGIFGCASVMLFVVTALPTEIHDQVLVGVRASRRREALERSGVLRLVWPLVRVFSTYARLLPQSFMDNRRRTLIQAGEPAGFSAEEFTGFNLVCAIGAAILMALVANLMGIGNGLAVAGFAFGLFWPGFWLAQVAQERVRAINKGLPQALDLMVMAMAAGLDFVGSLNYVVGMWSDKKDPLYDELCRMLQELALGKTHAQALQGFAERAPTELVREFVANVIQSERRGTPLIEVLTIQAEVARVKRFQTAEKVANRAGVLLLLPIMFCMGATLIVMFGNLIVKGFRGQLL
jgi:tight adherence protein C